MRRFPWLETGVVILIFSALIGLLLPSVQSPRDVGPRGRCSNNLHNIALALQQYEANLGCYPPPYIADANGKPMHSWRVLLLPFLDQKNLHSQYRFDEPWDGPNNRKLHDIELEIFRCPSQKKDKRPYTETNYVVVVGSQTVWPAESQSPIRADDISDGLDKTVLVVEVADSGIHWMEPRDLHINHMPLAINPPRGQGISSHHKGGANVSFADGSVRFLVNPLKPETLRAILTRNAHEPLPSSDTP